MSARALNAILPQIAGSPYEAHQKARTFASRYIKSGQYDTAIDVLFQSAKELLRVGQTGSGVDLTSFLLDVYDQKPEPITDESRGTLFSRFLCEMREVTYLDRSTDTVNCLDRTCWSMEEDGYR